MNTSDFVSSEISTLENDVTEEDQLDKKDYFRNN